MWDGKEPLTDWPELDYEAMRPDDGWDLIWTERPRVSAEMLAERALNQEETVFRRAKRQGPRRSVVLSGLADDAQWTAAEDQRIREELRRNTQQRR